MANSDNNNDFFEIEDTNTYNLKFKLKKPYSQYENLQVDTEYSAKYIPGEKLEINNSPDNTTIFVKSDKRSLDELIETIIVISSEIVSQAGGRRRRRKAKKSKKAKKTKKSKKSKKTKKSRKH